MKSQLDALRTLAEENILSSTRKLQAEFDTASQTLTKAAEGHGSVIRQEIDAFKAEMSRRLSEHRQGIDRQITDFLNMQNALVQNLTQQIDSYHRVSNALSAQLTAVTTQLEQFASTFESHKMAVAQKFEAHGKVVSMMSEQLNEIQARKKSWLPWGK